MGQMYRIALIMKFTSYVNAYIFCHAAVTNLLKVVLQFPCYILYDTLFLNKLSGHSSNI